MSVNRFNFTLVFYRLPVMLILVQKENELDEAHIYQDRYFKSSKIHQPTIMLSLEHTNHNINLNFLFQNLYKHFLCVRNLHQ